MGSKWLLIDGNNMLTKAFFAMDPITHKGQRIEALHGFFYDLIETRARFQCDNVVLCFDHGKSKRLDLLPTYKQSRKDFWEFQAQINPMKRRSFLDKQVKLLKETLPACGFRNVFYEDGFEADDLIAAIAGNIAEGDSTVIVSTDKDFHQCLRKGVTQYDHRNKTEFTRKQFEAVWGLPPKKWPYIKAIAGDATDDIPGVKGVAEKTAASFLREDLPDGARKQAILAFAEQAIKNQRLVLLPFIGTPTFAPQKQEWRSKVIAAVLKSLGITSLRP